MSGERTAVCIVGGGPAGLVLALELGRRGVSCIVFEEKEGPPTFPKANSTTSRTMEHYRRLGIADEIRPLGLPDEYAPDISYHTRYARHELARLHWPSRAEALRSRHQYDPHWPTPEPVHRAQQMLIEPVLKRHAERLPAIDLRFGWRVEEIAQDTDGVRLRARELSTGRVTEFRADYAVGCDGPRSLVREALGIRYAGIGAEDGDFMGGRMLAVHLDAPAFYDTVPVSRSWQHWALNRARSGILIAIDGRGRFVFHTQLPRGYAGTLDYARSSLALAAGCDFPYKILGIAEWTAGFTLVAERYGAGRIFLAGDAAHLFTPLGGLGMNTGIGDVMNLCWKIAARYQGWAGDGLLATYEQERRPIGLRNVQLGVACTRVMDGWKVPPDFESDSLAMQAEREKFGARIVEEDRAQYLTVGIQLGERYEGSPIVVPDTTPAPPDRWDHYDPIDRPGARAPHVWLMPQRALFDQFGLGFTLIDFVGSTDTSSLEEAARKRGVPLKILSLPDAPDHPYTKPLVLVRPDGHVAWHGDELPNPFALVDRIRGAA